MKNIFDYLLRKDHTLHEGTFSSFLKWMFPGDGSEDALSRRFLRWSVLYIIDQTSDKPTNLDFYSFFHGLDQSDPEAFFAQVSTTADIKAEMEKELGDFEVRQNDSDLLRSAFLHFIGTIMEHVAKESLFPDEAQSRQPSEQKRKGGTASNPFEGEGSGELKTFSNVIYLLFVLFLVALTLFNFLR